MTPAGDNEFEAVVVAKIGPVKATFTAAISLRDVVAPESYRLDVRVKGGPAGFAKGAATVNLEASGAGQTRLQYRIEGAIGGKLAQLGSRLVDAAARKLATGFFERFTAIFSTSEVAPEAPPPTLATP